MKKDVSQYAKIDPALLTDGLFVPRANKDRMINIENHWDQGVIRFRGVQLGAVHQSVLLAICARAGRGGELIVKGSKKDLHARQVELLHCVDDAREADTAIVEATAYSLLADAGLGDSGTSFDRLAEYLTDLQTLVVYRQLTGSKTGGGSNLLNFSHGAKKFRITLNWRLASAILGDAQFVKISLFERNQLTGPVAKILHAWLSSNTRLGRSFGFGKGVYIDTLLPHIWGHDNPSTDTIGQRRKRVKIALKDINGVNNWVCHQSGQKWHITRPKDLGNDWIASPGELKEAEMMSCIRLR
jgi:hypothetical protein